MHRLYWKIFLAFWLSLVFFLVVTLFSASYYLQQTRSRAADQNPHAQHMALVREARKVAAQGGVQALQSWLAQIDRSQVNPYYLIDRDGRDLLDRPVPPDLFARMMRDRRHMNSMNGMPMHSPMAIEVSNGHIFFLVPDFQGANLWRVLARPRVFALPLLITALLSGLLCYWLARYLLRPVERLREATKSIADGDFAQRVAPELGGRRDELADLAHDFDHMAQRIENLLASQMQLLGDISHELRSPLARLVVALELAHKKQGGESSAEFDRIALEVERMNELIGQVLTVTRMESGTRKITREVIDISRLLEDLVDSCNFEVAADEKRARITESEPATIKGDPALITSALENVIRNAAYYTKPGTTVDIDLQTRDEQLIIRVRDHGPGIPQEMLNRIFDPFVRVGQARDRNSGGYGLGLAIAQRSIVLHGGKIDAQNHAHGGLQISIRLPLLST